MTEDLFMLLLWYCLQYCLRFDKEVVHVMIVILSTITVYGMTEKWFMLLVYCYHYCLRYDRGVLHFVAVILSTITVYGMTEKWFMLLLYCLPLLFKVWQRSGSCCCCYVVYHYCLRFDSGMVHVVVVILYIFTV